MDFILLFFKVLVSVFRSISSGQCRPDSLRAVLVVVIVAFEHVGKEKELENEKHNEELHQYDGPQLAPHGHLGEAFDIEAENLSDGTRESV